ncbi:extracellular solute-binding protein [Marinicellulosiphila megalodicopiae]|uniref:extracellular solute-binding protein n=1 Tax=Marinicellulosiphila megalodicopiae TaxID=2724896 RepID=UPI003BAF0B85
MNKLNSIIKPVLFSAAVLLAGCGSDKEKDDNGDMDTTGEDLNTGQTVSLTGVVADGYLQGAKACLDMNLSGRCDDGEPFAITGAGGDFDLDVAIGNEDKFPVVVEVPIGAIDSDYGEVTQGYTLSAPAGKVAFISPMTTLIQAYMTINPGTSAEDAEDVLMFAMGLSTSDVSLFANYMVEKDTNEEYATMHVVAQVVAAEISDNMKSVDDGVASGAIDSASIQDKQAQVMTVIASKVSDQLTAIVSEVETAKANLAEGETLNVKTINENIDTQVVVEEIVSDIEKVDTLANANLTIDVYDSFNTYFEINNDDIFESKGIKATIRANDWGGHHNALDKNLTTGRGASDLILIDSGNIAEYIESDLIIDLTDSFVDLKSTLSAAAVTQGIDSKGQQKFIPIDMGPTVAFYRKDYMQDLDFDPVEVMATWDSFVEYGRYLKENVTTTYMTAKLDENGDSTFDENGDMIMEEITRPVYLISNTEALTRAIIYGNLIEGEGFFTDVNGEYDLESTRITKAFELTKLLVDEGLAAQTGLWNDAWYDGFNNGTFAIEIQGSWLKGTLESWIAPDTSGLWRVSELPEQTYSYSGGTFVAIPSQSKNKEAAWSMIEYMIDASTQLDAYKNWNMLPSNTSVYEDEYFDEAIEFLDGQAARKIYASSILNRPVVENSEFDRDASSIVFGRDIFVDLYESDKTVSEILNYSNKLLNCELELTEVCPIKIGGELIDSGFNEPSSPGNVQFKLVINNTSDIVMDIEGFNGLTIMLLNENFELIQTDISNRTHLDSLLEGTYYIEVTTISPHDSGEFTLIVDSQNEDDFGLTHHQDISMNNIVASVEAIWEQEETYDNAYAILELNILKTSNMQLNFYSQTGGQFILYDGDHNEILRSDVYYDIADYNLLDDIDVGTYYIEVINYNDYSDGYKIDIYSDVENSVTLSAPKHSDVNNQAPLFIINCTSTELIVTCNQNAEDPESDSLSFIWTIDGNQMDGEYVEYLYSEYGEKTITLLVSDGYNLVEKDFTFTLVQENLSLNTVSEFIGTWLPEGDNDNAYAEFNLVVSEDSIFQMKFISQTGGEIILYDQSNNVIVTSKVYYNQADYLYGVENIAAGNYRIEVVNYNDYSGNFQIEILSNLLDNIMITEPQSITNLAPQAEISANVTSGVATLDVSFDGRNSFDSNGSIEKFEWFVDGISIGEGGLIDYSFTQAGVYNVSLIVTDDQGATSENSMDITVSAANNAPVAEFICSKDGLTVTCDGSVSSDQDGDTLLFTWNVNGVTYNTISITHAFDLEGTYIISLMVSDSTNDDEKLYSITVN